MHISGLRDTISWYDANAGAYAQATADIASRDQLDQFTTLLPATARILDAGCGSGRDTALLQSGIRTAVGLDISSGLLEVARTAHPGMEFTLGDLRSIPYPDRSFDGVWSHASLLHLETIEDVRTTLGEFNRVMKQSGVLHVLVKAQTGNAKTAIVSDTLSHHDRFFQYFTRPELEALLIEAGFTIISIGKYAETDKNPKGRPEIEWILALARKN